MAARPFAPPPRHFGNAMGCSGSRSDLVKPQELLTEASEDQSPLKTFNSNAQALDLAPLEAALPGTQPEGETPGASSEPVIELLKDAKEERPTADPAASEQPVMATAATKEDLAVEDAAEPEAGEVNECQEPEMPWFDAARAGHLPNLQLHLQRAVSGSSELLEEAEAEERKTALHWAAEAGHMEACQWLLQAKADAMALTKKKATALHLAASGGHLPVLQLLLAEVPASLAALDLWRCSPLHRAAELGKDEVACYLLQRKADPQKGDREGNSPLHFACSAGCAGLVKELLKRQVPLDFTNNDGFSPLDLCVRKKQSEVGELLVSAGAKLVKDVRKAPPSLAQAAASGLPFFCRYLLKLDARIAKKELAAVDSEGRSPLLLAVHLGHHAVVECLLDHQPGDLEKVVPPLGVAPIHQAARSGQLKTLELLLERRASLELVDAQGSNCLFHAAEAAQLPMLQRLLEGADAALRPEHCDDRERSALHGAAFAGSVEACEVLLQAAKEKMELIKCQDWEGATAVHLGIKGGHADVCKYLMEENADLQQPLDFGVTPLQLAADLGHQQVLELLLEDLKYHCHDALQRALQGRSGDGRTAWLVACANGHLPCAQKLRSFADAQGIDVSKEEDRTKRKAMMLAAKGGHLEMCKWLLESGLADVKERDSCQWTPLHAASAEGHTELVEWLLKQGADVSAVDEDGLTAHSLARRRGAGAVEALLRRYAAKSAGA